VEEFLKKGQKTSKARVVVTNKEGKVVLEAKSEADYKAKRTPNQARIEATKSNRNR